MKKGYLFIFLSTILFSTMEIALKVFAGEFHPLQLHFLRFVVGSLVLLPLALRGIGRRGLSLARADYWFFAVTGFICIDISMVFYQLSIQFAPASTLAVLFSCNPVFVVILASLILGEKISGYTVASIIFSIAGILILISPFDFSQRFSGILLMLLSAVTFAFYAVIGRSRSERYGGLVFTCFSFVFGSAEMLILILLTHITPVAQFLQKTGLSIFAYVPVLSGIDLYSLLGLFYIGVFVTGLGYCFYFMAMEATSAATVSLIFYIKPALATLLAYLTLQEPITLNKSIGILLIAIGSLITLRKNHKGKK